MRLTEQECRHRLKSSSRAYLATVTPDGAPHIVPVTFAVTRDVIATAVDRKPKRSLDLARLRNVRDNPRAAVLADHYDDDWGALWWVRADGRAQVLTDGPVRDEALRMLANRYRQYRVEPPDGPVILVEVDRWTGWSAR